MTEPPQPPWVNPGSSPPSMPAPHYPPPGPGQPYPPPAPPGWHPYPGPTPVVRPPAHPGGALEYPGGVPVHHGYPGVPVPPPPPGPVVAQGRPVRIDPVPGTGFGIAYLPVNPTFLGLATGSMVAGIGTALVALVVICFGVAGASHGWGPLVSGAFAILSALLGAAAITLAMIALRQIGSARGRLKGRGAAIAGVWCGASGLAVAALGFVLALLIS